MAPNSRTMRLTNSMLRLHLERLSEVIVWGSCKKEREACGSGPRGLDERLSVVRE